VYADDLLRPWRDSLAEVLPGLDVFDAHTHTGQHDPDGFRCTPEQLLESLDLVGGRAAVFTMHEPAGYGPANDRVIAEAEASGGRLVPFCRVDPRADPGREAERALGRGARGIKLHPRSDDFQLADPRLEAVFEIAAERRVPIIVHAGRGIPALGRDALELTARYPSAPLILAHAGVCDLAWIWRQAAEHPNLYFDTAWWTPVDLITLLAYVPPGQILFGSDAPYGTPIHSFVVVFRAALQLGLSPEACASIAGAQLERLLDGQDPADIGPATGIGALEANPLLERVESYLLTAVGRMLLGDPAAEQLDLARLACEVGEDVPEAAVCRSVLAMLDRMDRYSRDGLFEGGAQEGAGPGHLFPGLHLIVAAAMLTRTPAVPLPPDPEPEDTGERQRG
jgi:predicted TIM-barrel fold metal-dependent hydrolase